MGVLQRFERRLEGLVEGAFAKVFKGVVEPVEIAAALQREADDKKAILGPGRVLVPNDFTVELSKADSERLAPYAGPLGTELAGMVREHAGEQGWHFVGPVRVRLERDEELDTGVFRVRSAVAQEPRVDAGVNHPVEQGTPERPPLQPYSGRPRLVVAAGGDAAPDSPEAFGVEQVFELDKPVTLLGRAADADLRLDDTGVSRRHGEVRIEDGDVVYVDLGSTNGSRVNGREVGRHVLSDADRVTVGSTTLVFRRDVR